MLLKHSSLSANFIIFIILIFSSVISYMLCQLTKFPYLYLNLPMLIFLDRKAYVPLLIIILISLFDEQMLNFPVGILASINTLVLSLYRVITRKIKILLY